MTIENPLHLQLQTRIADYLENELKAMPDQDVRINVRNIDPRIDVPFCEQGYEFNHNGLSLQQSNVSIKVSCADTNWYVFSHATIAVIQEVVVSKDNLSPGVLLSASNLEVIEMDKNKLRGSSFNTIEDITGARLKRRIRAGNIIDGRMLCFVCKGDRVTIAATSGGLSLKVYGVAEQDGILGDTIQVRNISSDKLVFGKISSTSEVEIKI
jgi:flagella basal body P-ring formation protein FlgA